MNKSLLLSTLKKETIAITRANLYSKTRTKIHNFEIEIKNEKPLKISRIGLLSELT